MDKLLPLGSIVKLKEANKYLEFMISGYYIYDEDAEKIYDYLGLLYPQGMLSNESFLSFNSEDIEEIIFEGYRDEEGEELREALPVLLKSIAESEGE